MTITGDSMRGQIRYNESIQLHLMRGIYASNTCDGNIKNSLVATCYTFSKNITVRS